jgi:hypothetical protein
MPKLPGRPCAVCCHANRAAIEAAVTRGAPLRMIGRANGISPRAIGRHMEKHPQLPAAKPVLVAAEPLLDASGNITLDAFGRPIVNGHGTSPPVPAPSLRHPERWWTPTAPGPRLGDRCVVCGGKEWWYIPDSWGGSACWTPVFYGDRKRYFTT